MVIMIRRIAEIMSTVWNVFGDAIAETADDSVLWYIRSIEEVVGERTELQSTFGST